MEPLAISMSHRCSGPSMAAVLRAHRFQGGYAHLLMPVRYLSDYIQHVTDSNHRCLRSTSSSQLVIRQTWLSIVSNRSFPVASRTVCHTTSHQLQCSLFSRKDSNCPISAVFCQNLSSLDLKLLTESASMMSCGRLFQ